MSSEVVVTNTLAFLFPAGAAQPAIDEMARFVKTLVADKTDMEAAYKISEERSVFVKFKSEAAMEKAFMLNPTKHTFHYSNGKVVELRMSVAGANIRYVRIFDLPPEVSDQDISLVLEEYGKVTQVEREKFPVNLGLGDMVTGVRGVHMDIETDIPPILRFGSRKGRIYYDEMKPKCYLCLSEGHLKAVCPNKKARPGKSGEETKSNRNTYADIAAGSTAPNEIEGNVPEQEKEEEEEDKTSDNGKQPNKRQHQQQQIQPVRLYQQKPLKYGSWTEYVQLHTKLVKEQQKIQKQQSANEASPPRKNHRPNSPRSGSSSN